jgi:hypothetical protein
MLPKSVPNNHYRHGDQNPKDHIIGVGHGMARAPNFRCMHNPTTLSFIL